MPRAEPPASAGAALPLGDAPPGLPPPPAPSTEAPAAVSTSSVERVIAKESFAADEPLPAFTFPVLDEAKKQELLRRVEAARPPSSVERVVAKESFAADEPLPAFTFPVLDEAKKQELLRRVEEARALSALAPMPPPAVPPPTREVRPESSARRLEPAKLLSELRRIGLGAWARASVLAGRWIDTACTFIDRSRSRLPVRLRGPLSKVRTGVIFAALATLAFSILVGGLLLIGAGRAEKRAPGPMPSALKPLPVPKEDPVPREIEQAKKQGHSALEKLAERFPKDYRVWLELAASSSAKGDHAAAVSAVGKALAADPKANEQALASDVLALAIRKRDTTKAASELILGRMGSAGAAVLYDLSIDPTVALPLRGRAEAWVRSEAFKRVAVPDVEIAGALRYAKSCSDRHDLLPRAAEKGSRRVLDYLNMAKTPSGCGRNARKDCFPCMRKDDALKDAISAIEQRLAGK